MRIFGDPAMTRAAESRSRGRQRQESTALWKRRAGTARGTVKPVLARTVSGSSVSHTLMDRHGKTALWSAVTCYRFGRKEAWRSSHPFSQPTVIGQGQSGNKLPHSKARRPSSVLDGDNRTTATKDALGNTNKTCYDAAGNTVQTVDPNGHSTQYVYNKDNLQSGSVDPDGDQPTTDYNKVGQTSAGYDGNQNGSFSGYNADGDDTGSGQATGSAADTSYNALNQEVQVIDADGNVTTFLLDRDGNQVAEISPLGHFSYTAYNQDNQPVTQVNADGRTTSSTYDPAGRLITQTWTAADGTQTNVLTYSYDPVGNTTAAGNAYGDYTFTYDPANRVLTQTDPFNLTLTFGYDANGNVTSVADSAGGTVTSIYNGDNQLTSRRFATTANGTPASVQLRMDLAYTPAGQIATETRYAGTAGTDLLGQTQFTWYDNQNHLLTASEYSSGQLVKQETNSYDVFGNLVEQDETTGGNTTVTKFANQVKNNGGESFVWADLNATNQIQTRRVYLDAVNAVCAGLAPVVPWAGT